MTAPPTYEIRIADQLDEDTLQSFTGLDVTVRAAVTVITGQFDQAALHGMLEMIRALGLDLLEARRIGVPLPRDNSGAPDHGQHGAVRPDPGRRPR